ncbi:MAG: DNA-3-methyladenine glycosylase family protein [Bryobacteraceae bacterium]
MRKAILHLKNADPILAGIIARVGPLRIQYREPCFQTLVRSIVYQQLSGKAALTIFNRLTAKAGEPLTPEAILRLRPATLRGVGLSQQKTNYVRDLALRTRKGEIDFACLEALADHEIVGHLTQVKGIGVWTVHMFLIFALRRPNVLPTGDLGVRAAIQKAYKLPELPKPEEIEKIAQAWHPFCSIASWYLWRSLENPATL